MTKIPDDVVERAARAICKIYRITPDSYQTKHGKKIFAWEGFIKDAIAAGEVFVEWAMEEAARKAESGIIEGVDENNPAHDDKDRAYNMSRRHAAADIRALKDT